MATFIKSMVTASFIAAAVTVFSIRLVAPALPPFVGPPDYDETRLLNLPVAKRLVVLTEDGTVRIEATSQNSIVVEAHIRIYDRGRSDAATLKAAAGDLVQATRDGDKLEIATLPDALRLDGDAVVDYVIRVPRGTDVDVIGSNGNIWIAEGCGRVAVFGGNSDIEIKGPLGIVIAKSENGRIRLIESMEDATLEAVNGSVYADVRGGTLEASTINGHIIARVLDSGVIACDLVSENGSITIELATSASFSYDARTDRGIIRSDFALSGEGDSGVLNRKHIQGALGSGGPALTVDAMNGNIWFKKRTRELKRAL